MLDPGHSGGPNFDSTAEVDGPKPVTGLGITFHAVDIDDSGIMSIDNSGAPGERATMWRAALRIRTILHSAGYTVDLTKSSANIRGPPDRARRASPRRPRICAEEQESPASPPARGFRRAEA